MDAQFDYFLILGACAFVLVVWLVWRALKSGHSKNDGSRSKPSYKASAKKRRSSGPRDRVSARAGSAVSKNKIQEAQEPRLTTLCFTDGRPYPFAVANLSSDFWLHSDRPVFLPQRLQETLDRYLPLSEDCPARLFHMIDTPRTGRPIILRGFDEKGNVWQKPLVAGLNGEDFSLEPSPNSLVNEISEKLRAYYRAQFRVLEAADQAALIALENHPENLLTARVNVSAQKAYRALLLQAILFNTDTLCHFQLINCYFSHFEYSPTNTSELTLYQLIISQTFAQTQMLPFLLVSNTKSGVKCYNALNY